MSVCFIFHWAVFFGAFSFYSRSNLLPLSILSLPHGTPFPSFQADPSYRVRRKIQFSHYTSCSLLHSPCIFLFILVRGAFAPTLSTPRALCVYRCMPSCITFLLYSFVLISQILLRSPRKHYFTILLFSVLATRRRWKYGSHEEAFSSFGKTFPIPHIAA